MSKRGGLRIHFNSSTFRIDLKGLMSMRLKLTFKPDGVLDFEALYQQMLDCIHYNMGTTLDITAEKRQKLRKQLAATVIKKAIWSRDVLNSFKAIGQPTLGHDGKISIPLEMAHSCYRMSLEVDYKAGSLNLTRLPQSFEDAYKAVMRPSKFDQQCLHIDQHQAIQKDGPMWLAEKAKPLAGKIIDAYSFKVVFDSECCLRENGTLRVYLVNSITEYEGASQSIPAPVGSKNTDMRDDLSPALEEILKAHLADLPVPLLFEDKHIKAIKQNWIYQAGMWLKGDIQAEQDIGACFEFLPKEGKGIWVKTELRKDGFWLGLVFDENGCCDIEERMDVVSNWVDGLVGASGALDGGKRKQLKPHLAEVMTDTMRNPDFSYPFKPGTFAEVRDVKDSLEDAAKEFKMDSLAMAGAYADILEIDSAADMSKYHDWAMEPFARGAAQWAIKNKDKIGATMSLAEEAAKRVGKIIPWVARHNVPLQIINLVWTAMPDENKKQMVDALCKFAYLWGSLPERAMDMIEV